MFVPVTNRMANCDSALPLIMAEDGIIDILGVTEISWPTGKLITLFVHELDMQSSNAAEYDKQQSARKAAAVNLPSCMAAGECFLLSQKKSKRTGHLFPLSPNTHIHTQRLNKWL